MNIRNGSIAKNAITANFALTTKGSIYYVPEIKNPKPIFHEFKATEENSGIIAWFIDIEEH